MRGTSAESQLALRWAAEDELRWDEVPASIRAELEGFSPTGFIRHARRTTDKSLNVSLLTYPACGGRGL